MAITRDKILGVARSLPPGPQVFSELGEMLHDSDRGLDEIAAVIKRDATLAAHLIRMSNSAVYGGEQRTGSVEEAVGRVGLQEIFRLVSEVASARLVDRALTRYGIEAAELRNLMLATALVCEELAQECGVDPKSAYTAGLMRPLGLLVLDRLAEGFEKLERYHPVHDSDYLSWEGRVFGLASSEVAALVLTEWSFRPDIVEAVRNQHLLRTEDFEQPLACLLNLASGFIADEGSGLLGEMKHWSTTERKLSAVGLTGKAFKAAGKRAQAALVSFQKRWKTDENQAEPSADAPPGSAKISVVLSYDAAIANPATSAGDSCNFPVKVRVIHANDDTPVHTQTTGLITPIDFTTFMRNYQDMVFSTAIRLVGNEAQAEDISQEVFLKAYERFDSLQASPTAGGWLKTVATNLSLNHLTRYRNRWRFFSEFRRDESGGGESEQPDVEFAAPDTFFSGVDAGERREWLQQALEKLPDHQRVPLVLYHFEDMPYDAIAQRLNISLAKVKTDILRARAALAQLLEHSGTSHEKFTP